MARVTVTLTISLPPAMAAQMQELYNKEHRTRSELLREAIRCYVMSRELVGAHRS